jgi:hypothetical protein
MNDQPLLKRHNQWAGWVVLVSTKLGPFILHIGKPVGLKHIEALFRLRHTERASIRGFKVLTEVRVPGIPLPEFRDRHGNQIADQFPGVAIEEEEEMFQWIDDLGTSTILTELLQPDNYVQWHKNPYKKIQVLIHEYGAESTPHYSGYRKVFDMNEAEYFISQFRRQGNQ